MTLPTCDRDRDRYDRRMRCKLKGGGSLVISRRHGQIGGESRLAPRFQRLSLARMAAAGGDVGPHRPKGMWSVDLLFGPRFYSWGFCSMNESKSKKSAPLHDGFRMGGRGRSSAPGCPVEPSGPSHGAAEHADRGLCQFEPGWPDQRSNHGRALNHSSTDVSPIESLRSLAPTSHEPTTVTKPEPRETRKPNLLPDAFAGDEVRFFVALASHLN